MNRHWIAVIRLTLVGLLATVAAVASWPVFTPSGRLVLATLVPIGVAVGWAVVLAVWAPDRRDLATTSVGVLAVGAAVAVTTTPGRAVLSGPYRVLTGALPLDPSGPELAAVAGVSGYAALAAGYFAVRARSPLAPLVPPLLCLLIGLGLSASTGGPPGWCGPAFVVVAALHLVIREVGARQPVAAVRSATVGVVLAALVGVAVPVLTSHAPGVGGRPPADLRALVAAPVRPTNPVNPIAQYLALYRGKLPQEITGTANAQFDRLRMVTLTEFDGQSWSSRADYRRAGTQLPAPPAEAGQHRVTAEVELAYPGGVGWLPSPGRASTVDVAGLGVSERTGDLVVPAGMRTPPRYRVTAVSNQVENVDRLRADAPAATATEVGVELPTEQLSFVQSATAGEPDGFPRFAGLYRAFKNGGFRQDVSEQPPGGNGMYQISELLRQKRGTSEQFASAFALLGRHLGWETRVVLGFNITWDGDQFTARGQDVAAWVEVRFTELGWIPVDPTPDATTDNDKQPDAGQAERTDPVEEGANAEQLPPAPPEPGKAPPATPPPATADESTTALWPTLLFVIAGGIMVFLVTVPLAKYIRSRRRRGMRSTRDAAVGAWREAVDYLCQLGMPLPRYGTTGEVLVAAGPAADGNFVTLATLVDEALYAPTDLPQHRLGTAWQASDAVRQAGRGRASFLTRVLATFNPRPLTVRSNRG